MIFHTIISNQRLGQSIRAQHLIPGPLCVLAHFHLHPATSATQKKRRKKSLTFMRIQLAPSIKKNSLIRINFQHNRTFSPCF